MAIPPQFLDRFADPSPSLRVQLDPSTDEKPQTIKVKHSLGERPSSDGRAFLKTLGKSSELKEFLEFYTKYDGFQFCWTLDSKSGKICPLIEFVPTENLASFTSRYLPGGDLAWIIDLNKSREMYRGSDRWLAFAEVNSGPACLTIFLEGDQAGCVFFATPQPWFNILRPIAKGFHLLLRRFVDDVPAFMRLVRAYVSRRGADGRNYGLQPVEYRPGKSGPSSSKLPS
jgi:hypothetical protein